MRSIKHSPGQIDSVLPGLKQRSYRDAGGLGRIEANGGLTFVTDAPVSHCSATRILAPCFAISHLFCLVFPLVFRRLFFPRLPCPSDSPCHWPRSAVSCCPLHPRSPGPPRHFSVRRQRSKRSNPLAPSRTAGVREPSRN